MASILPKETLRIALLNSADAGGGAESCATMLTAGLIDRRHEATLWVGRCTADISDDYIRSIPVTSLERQAARRYAAKGFYNLGLEAAQKFAISPPMVDVDIIHMHNSHGHYFSIDAVPILADHAPLVWTVHDFFSVTGGCAFPRGCDRWQSECGNCPALGQYPLVTSYDRTKRLQSIKRKAYAELAVTIVSPSKHLAAAVGRSGMFPRAEVRIIPYGVDTDVFVPDRVAARRALGIAPTASVVTLVAQGLDDPRKGITFAVDALRRLAASPLTVLLVGGGEAATLESALPPHDVRLMGYLSDRGELAKCLTAADVFVFTSLAENFPCVVQEAMACGTTVVAFDIDGVNEQIVDGRSGVLTPVEDAAALSRAIQQQFEDETARRGLGEAARRHALQHWTRNEFVTRYESLYRELLARPALDRHGAAATAAVR